MAQPPFGDDGIVEVAEHRLHTGHGLRPFGRRVAHLCGHGLDGVPALLGPLAHLVEVGIRWILGEGLDEPPQALPRPAHDRGVDVGVRPAGGVIEGGDDSRAAGVSQGVEERRLVARALGRKPVEHTTRVGGVLRR